GPGGVRLGGAAASTTAELELGGALGAGAWMLSFEATASATPVRLRVATSVGAPLADVAVPPGQPLHVVTAVAHAGGPLRLVATVTGGAGATILVSDARLDREAVPDPVAPGS